MIDDVDSIMQASDRIKFISRLNELFQTLPDGVRQKFGTPRSMEYFNNLQVSKILPHVTLPVIVKI